MAARCLTAVLIAISLIPQIAHAGGPAPGCRNPTEWHLVAGWLGQPLGSGNYSAQPSA
jgi:hypothetical protein